MNTTTTSGTPQSITNKCRPFARGAIIDGKRVEHWPAIESRLTDPLRWKKPRRVFVNSMSDLFHESVPFEFVDRVFAVMALCPQHTFQVLTKRPERMAEYISQFYPEGGRLDRMMDGAGLVDDPWHGKMEDDGELYHRLATCDVLPNVWLGTSVENQACADERIPHLLKCPAAVRFLSCEPLLGPLDLSAFFGGPYVGLPGDRVHDNYNFGINWVIVGGESGPKSRPCDVEWIRSIVGQCKAAGVPCFVKQLGAKLLIRNDSHTEWPREGDGLLYDVDGPGWSYQGELHEVRLEDRKGGDPSEWPEDLRVREWPT